MYKNSRSFLEENRIFLFLMKACIYFNEMLHDCFAKQQVCHGILSFSIWIVKEKTWLQTAYFKSDFCVNVHIWAIFAVGVDFAFVASFFAFSLKTRNCNFFINDMVFGGYIKNSTHSRYASFPTSAIAVLECYAEENMSTYV